MALGVLARDLVRPVAARVRRLRRRSSSSRTTWSSAGGRFHDTFWFALAWGAFPALTAYFVDGRAACASRRSSWPPTRSCSASRSGGSRPSCARPAPDARDLRDDRARGRDGRADRRRDADPRAGGGAAAPRRRRRPRSLSRSFSCTCRVAAPVTAESVVPGGLRGSGLLVAASFVAVLLRPVSARVAQGRCAGVCGRRARRLDRVRLRARTRARRRRGRADRSAVVAELGALVLATRSRGGATPKATSCGQRAVSTRLIAEENERRAQELSQHARSGARRRQLDARRRGAQVRARAPSASSPSAKSRRERSSPRHSAARSQRADERVAALAATWSSSSTASAPRSSGSARRQTPADRRGGAPDRIGQTRRLDAATRSNAPR